MIAAGGSSVQNLSEKLADVMQQNKGNKINDGSTMQHNKQKQSREEEQSGTKSGSAE